ncbi:DUF6798 domain-containing protein [Pseudoxanthomonas spadix]|uniref:DUF6798 domain-containing protein n=1 Tax=Pseudoxanthomonas spadix TaxID=415229 RepID=UPI001475DB73|nr:DUF6798 domain-containing protein [Pseudoxanthomonas spadix]MBP3975818.1 hypothetical protein [Pseudoxanthomonas spadix]
MSQPPSLQVPNRPLALAAIVACAALAIALDHGIQVGRENHAGLIPVVRRLLDPGYLPGDFGIQLRAHHHRIFALLVAALALPLGERAAFAVLTWSGYLLVFAALWQLGAALALARGRRMLLAVALASGFAFLDHGVEANRFLGNGPIMPPTFAHAGIVFALAALVRGRWNLALALSGAVALVHLQIGGIWMLVMALEATRQRIWRRPARWLPGLAAALLIAAPALFDLVALAQQGLTRQMGALQDVAFRMPQHFTFHGNRMAVVLLYLGLFAWTWRRWRSRGDARATRFAPLLSVALILMAFTVLHYLDYYLLRSGWIARAQLLRLSMFVPVLAACALLAQGPWPAPRAERWPWLAAALFALGALGVAFAKGEPPSLRVVDAARMRGDWTELCDWVRARGPQVLYATPPGHVGFTACSDRSTLVEFKINPDGGAGREQWLERLHAITGGALPTGAGRIEVAQALDAAYARLPASGLAALARDYGVRAAVVPVASPLRGPELYRNAGYRVVALDATLAAEPSR